MNVYVAYGLRIHSEIPLPELPVTSSTPDVIVQLRKLDHLAQVATRGENQFLGEVLNVGTFMVRDGCQILVDPVLGVDEALLRTILLGPFMAVLLRQRGLLVLHASSVAMNGTAVAFLGASGSGKSTLALSFHILGYSLVTDDMMAVQTGLPHPVVLPSYPSVKLLPDVATILGYAFEQLSPLHSRSEKRVCLATQGFPQDSLPLKRIYVLEVGTHHAIEPLRPQDIFVELVRNSRAVGLLRSTSFVHTHFHQCAGLAENVSVRRLRRQPSLAALPDILRMVEEDLR
jgi:hypothetical protein